MKFIYLLLILACTEAHAQVSKNDLIGSWNLKQHIKDSIDCAPFVKLSYKFQADGTYEKNSDGYVFKGKWRLDGDQLILFETRMPNGKFNKIYDGSWHVEMTDEGNLHFWEYVCMDTEPLPNASPGPFKSIYERVE